MTKQIIHLKHHFPFLDGLRGLAIISVIIYHCFPELLFSKIGWVGVDLFFVLSGFLITGILVESKEKPFFFKNFFIRRALRIFPLYYLFLILMFFILPLIKNEPLGDFSYYQGHQMYFWLYIQNWLYSLEGFPKNFALHHLWSLGVEEQFYLLWPFVIYMMSFKRIIYVAVLLIFLAVFFRHFGSLAGFVFPYKYVNIFSRMDALLMGALVMLLLKEFPNLIKKYALIGFLLSALIIICYIGLHKTLDFWYLDNVYSFIGLAFACFLAICCADFKYSALLRSYLDTKILKWFGKYSYGIYIYHYPIYFICLKFLVPVFKNHGLSVLIADLLSGLSCIIITCIISYFSFNYFEVKFLSMKDRWTTKSVSNTTDIKGFSTK